MIDFTICDGTFTCLHCMALDAATFAQTPELVAQVQQEYYTQALNPENGHDWRTCMCDSCNKYAPF